MVVCVCVCNERFSSLNCFFFSCSVSESVFFTKVEPEVNCQTVQVSLALLLHLFGHVVLVASILVGITCVNSFMTFAYRQQSAVSFLMWTDGALGCCHRWIEWK